MTKSTVKKDTKTTVKKEISSTVAKEVIQSIEQGTHGSPYDVLGIHKVSQPKTGVSIRTFQPYADKVEIINQVDNSIHATVRTGKQGFFEAFFPEKDPFVYTLRMTGYDNAVWELEDPYRFPLIISDFDLYLFGEGTDYRTYEKMGAHPKTIDGVEGVHFAIWAPNAIRVSVIGMFNRWDGRHHPMQQRAHSGLWELFLPRLCPGDIYKFEIKGHNGFLGQKADPYGFAAELRPQTASVVWDIHQYKWNDDNWMSSRRKTNWYEEPISVYELHPGSWKRVPEEGNRWLTYREMAEDLIPYVKELGFTHIELLPISEHPFDGSWGYQTIGYYAPTSRFGTPDDFKYFVDKCHEAGIGVLLDWVPAHFPKDGHGLGYFDGTHLYEHADPRQGEHRDWGTLIFNYGRNEVKTFLLSNALFWADVYHIDGLRVDAVASMLYLDYSREDGEWIPNEYGGRENLPAVDFLKRFNEIIHEQYPGITTFAEESTAWPMVSRPTYLGGLGFDFKWNMGWMHDTLEYFSKEAVHRKYHHNNITFSLLYAFSENFILPFSHDEVVHGKRSMLDKMPGDAWQKFANLRLLYSYMYAHPGKKLVFMGCEIGQWNEWNFQSSVEWNLLDFEPHRRLKDCLATLNNFYRDLPEMHKIDFSWDGFEWIDFHDSDQSIVSFIRKTQQDASTEHTACVYNFTPVPRHNYRLGVPAHGRYEEIYNSDSTEFGGSGVNNGGAVYSEPTPWQGQAFSICVTLPPLGACYFRHVPEQQ
jgi:1,4-alpha-glucan branching enzyme